MRVLLVTHFYPSHRSGIALVAGQLAGRLARLGFHLTWAASDAAGVAGTDGAELLPMPSWNGIENRLGVPYPVWSPGALAQLAAAVRRADVVHLHDALYFGNAAAYHLARRYHKPVVITQHIGSIPYKNPGLRGLMWAANRTVARTLLRGADRVVFIAPRVRDYFRQFVRFRSEPEFLPNGVDTGLFRPADERAAVRKQLGWPSDQPVLLFVGRFVEKKGLAVLRGAAELLPDCQFVFAGWGVIDPGEWGLPNVHVAGSLPPERLAPLYQAADLMVLPSVGEGFPLVVQESMACGTPALISGETAADYPGAAGWAVVADPEPHAVAEAVRTAVADPAELAQRRERVAEIARQEWDWDRCAAAYAAMFRGLA